MSKNTSIKKNFIILSQKQQLSWILGAGILCFLLVCWIIFFSSNEGKKEMTQSANGIVKLSNAQYSELSFSPVEMREFRDITNADGKISANVDQSTPVYTPYTGMIVNVLVSPGDRVKKGQPLFAIDANEYIQGRSDLTAALAALETAKNQTLVANANANRTEALFKNAGGSLKDWQQAQQDLINARNSEITLAASLEMIKNKLKILGLSDSEIASLPTQKKTSTLVRAPISGIVAKRNLSIGQYLSNNTDPAVIITNISTVWVEAQVSEEDSGKIQLNQEAIVHVSAYPNRNYNAKITSISPVIDPDSHRLPIRAQIANDDEQLKPDMFANFEIYSQKVSKSLSVPIDAVIREDDEARVWVINRDHEAHYQKVVIGLINNGFVEIKEGLKAGETVVVKGALFVDKAGLG